MMTKYTARFFSDTYILRADWADAASSIERQDEDGEWTATGRQVADYGHSSGAAMRDEIEQSITADGDSVTLWTLEINEAIARIYPD